MPPAGLVGSGALRWYREVLASIVAIHDDAEGSRVILNAEKCPPVSVAPGYLVMFRVY